MVCCGGEERARLELCITKIIIQVALRMVHDMEYDTGPSAQICA
jgi:hypothetical protein